MRQLTLQLPDELSNYLGTLHEEDLSRAAIEAIALEAYREKKLTTSQLRRVLGFQSRFRVHEFLKLHDVHLNYDQEDLDHDRQVSDRMRAERG